MLIMLREITSRPRKNNYCPQSESTGEPEHRALQRATERRVQAPACIQNPSNHKGKKGEQENYHSKARATAKLGGHHEPSQSAGRSTAQHA
jgi:hypothetical protein